MCCGDQLNPPPNSDIAWLYLEITLSKPEDLERAMPLLKRSYEDA